MADIESASTVYNPNQRQFLEDKMRYKKKLEQLQTGSSGLIQQIQSINEYIL